MHAMAVYQPLYQRHVTLRVTAASDAVYDSRMQLIFDANEVVLPDGSSPHGRLRVSGFGAQDVHEGDVLEITGKLRPGYAAYQGVMSFAQVTLVGRQPDMLSVVRQRFTAGVQSALPEPLASFVMGLLLGQRTTLSPQVTQDFLHVGLTHIVAVSGANLTVLLHAVRRLLGTRSKRASTLTMVAVVVLFVALTAGSASIVRAAIVSMLSVVTSYRGYMLRPLNLLAWAAVITAWANPVYVWHDLGWYLSFLAFLGVLVLAPLLERRWPARWQQTLLGGVALETICAEILTLPLILCMFGQLSFVSLLANVLVVTMIPCAMLFGTVAGVAGMVCAPLAGWVAWPAVLVLNYMLDVAHLLASLPHTFVQNQYISVGSMTLAYGLILGFMASLHHKTKAQKPATITDILLATKRGLVA